jgi:hypothetical protein
MQSATAAFGLVGTKPPDKYLFVSICSKLLNVVSWMRWPKRNEAAKLNWCQRISCCSLLPLSGTSKLLHPLLHDLLANPLIIP